MNKSVTVTAIRMWIAPMEMKIKFDLTTLDAFTNSRTIRNGSDYLDVKASNTNIWKENIAKKNLKETRQEMEARVS